LENLTGILADVAKARPSPLLQVDQFLDRFEDQYRVDGTEELRSKLSGLSLD
jgi:hypothetical protein